MRKKWTKILPLILLTLAIGLSPSFSAGEFGGGKIIELRIEDFLILILGLIWFANFLISGRKKVEKPPLFFPILVWLAIGLLGILTNWLFAELSFSRGFFYFLKEIEFFFLYFYFFYHIKKINSAKFIVGLWILLGMVNAGYVIYQTITGFRKGVYGAAAICERGPFPTGAFFLILFIFLFNIFLYYFLNLKISKFKKFIIGAVIVLLTIGIFGSGSRTNFAGLFFAFFLTLFFLLLRKKSFKLFLVIILTTIFIVGIFIFAFQNIPVVSRITGMLSSTGALEGFKAGRVPVISQHLEEFLNSSPFVFIFGFGKGYVAEAHNHYIRNLLEIGILGSFVVFWLFFAIIKKAFLGFSKSRDGFSIGLSAGLLIATLTMLFLAMAAEVFFVVKFSEVYWSFAALTMAVLVLKPRKT